MEYKLNVKLHTKSFTCAITCYLYYKIVKRQRKHIVPFHRLETFEAKNSFETLLESKMKIQKNVLSSRR